jgi:hypothetical protein
MARAKKEEVIEITYSRRAAHVRRYLKNLDTRQLMEIHRQCRAYGGQYDCFPGFPTQSGMLSLKRSEIKAELDTREHVPNKIEAKKKRQAAAKTNKPATKRKYVSGKTFGGEGSKRPALNYDM